MSPSVRQKDPADETFVIETVEQVKALTHPLRQRILEQFARRPRTTKQVADELGEKPTRLYHHVAALERAGLVRLVETRPKRGTTEKYFAAVARRFEIDPRAFGGEHGKVTLRHPSVAVLDSVLENTRTELAELVEHESAESLAEEAMFLRLELRGDRASIAAARSKLEALVRELEQSSQNDGDESCSQRLLLGWYPLGRSS